ncbi:MAG: hypothetical protein MK101_04920, partial [Phycisphaerales bacterium]|nr:hypothetical protein [Phycisphaerales bacterium]
MSDRPAAGAQGMSSLLQDSRGLRRVTFGFASTAAMWFYTYIAMLEPGLVMGEILFGLAIASLFYGSLLST